MNPRKPKLPLKVCNYREHNVQPKFYRPNPVDHDKNISFFYIEIQFKIIFFC